MRQNSNHVPVALDDWRGWITARAQELKRYYPLRSKKDCWRVAHSEWLDLRQKQKREQREKIRTLRPRPFGR
jgi:hypothetical protein